MNIEKTKKNSKLNSVTMVNNTVMNDDVIANGTLILEHYVIIKKLSASSGEADIYLCHEKDDNTAKFIFKLFRRKDPLNKYVFDKLKSLNCPNVSHIIEIGSYDGKSYVLMPYYSNGTLNDTYLKIGKTFSLKEIKEYILPSVLNGINALHANGIIHKDLKPSNIAISDSNTLVIIDFGISSSIKDSTIVVTHSGLTPAYIAPEALSGTFLRETDYYALGILLYELYTGHTPYEQLSEDQIVSFASIQKIPFPNEFPQELKELIEGLTYKDLSNRKNKLNPNRRWGYEEVNNWLNGIKQTVPGSIIINANQNFPYKFLGKIYQNNYDLIVAFLSNWEDAKAEVWRGFLARYYDMNNNDYAKKLCEQTERLYEENENKSDCLFFSLMYQLEPKITFLQWKNYRFENLIDFGNRLIEEVNKEDPYDIDLELCRLSKELLVNGILEKYCLFCEKENQEKYLNIITAKYCQMREVPLHHSGQAIRLGHALTGREDFIFGEYYYENYASFGEFLIELSESYSKSIDDFLNLIDPVYEELKILANVLPETYNVKIFEFLKKRDDIILLCDDKYSFYNIYTFEKYVNELWQASKIATLYKFAKDCESDINLLEEEGKGDVISVIASYKDKISKIIKISNFVFRDFDQFVSYLKNLQSTDSNQFDQFKTNHRKDLIKLYRKLSKDQQLLLMKNFGIYQLVNGDIKVGNTVLFGNMIQEDPVKPEPVEWIVLNTDEHSALLLSKYALESLQFHHIYKEVTWEECSLRKWCNKELPNEIFNKYEYAEILLTDVINEQCNERGIKGGKNTKDKVFLLSLDEVKKYLPTEEQRCCKPSFRAIDNEVWVCPPDKNDLESSERISHQGNCSWFLRTPGSTSDRVCNIRASGEVADFGCYVHDDSIGIRVAIKVVI